MSIFKELGFQPETERPSEAVLYSLARTTTLLTKALTPHYRRHGLTPASLNVLMVVKHVGGKTGLSQQAIGSRLIISNSNVTGLIDRLERQSLLTRTPSRRDRREKVIQITAKGSKLLDQLWPGHLDTTHRLTACLTAEEKATLVRLLDKLRARVG